MIMMMGIVSVERCCRLYYVVWV